MSLPKHITIKPTIPHDIDDLMRDIRESDVKEIESSGAFQTVRDAATHGLHMGEITLTIRRNGRVMMIGGLVSTRPDPGKMMLWGYGTNEINRHKKDFLRASQDAYRMLTDSQPGPRLFINAMPDSFTMYKKWAERYLGAEFAPVSFITQTGDAFRAFAIFKKGA